MKNELLNLINSSSEQNLESDYEQIYKNQEYLDFEDIKLWLFEL